MNGVQCNAGPGNLFQVRKVAWHRGACGRWCPEVEILHRDADARVLSSAVLSLSLYFCVSIYLFLSAEKLYLSLYLETCPIPRSRIELKDLPQ